MVRNFFRKHRGTRTRRELAIKLGITERTIANWEFYITHPDLSQAAALAPIYGVTPETIERAIVEQSRHIQASKAETSK